MKLLWGGLCAVSCVCFVSQRLWIHAACPSTAPQPPAALSSIAELNNPTLCHGRKPFHRRGVLSHFLQALRGVREEELVQYGMKKGHARFVVTSLAAGFGL